MYIGRNSSHVAKHSWIHRRVDRGATGWLTALCQAVSLCCHLSLLRPLHTNHTNGSAFQQLILPGLCSPRSPGTAEAGANEMDPMPETRQPALQDPPPLAGTCAVANVASCMLGAFYVHSRFRYLFITTVQRPQRCVLPDSSPKQRPPPALRVGARLVSPPRTAVTNRRDSKQMGPQPFRPWRH